ncbi:B3 domain-containing protein At5g60140-like isoform X2 [Solanum dulcamara]|uniref:B3 domain-containing protein At5g60140-like isoform X2 n=1 Tax=Solanum dulcamara TaxID=45834 RepID=UPI0024856C7B|nr:B3 domain-containing protein At5g60140-like isoform X2 [Solanum dulcamara]
MEKSFFKVFNPKTSAKQMKIPTSYTNYKNGKIPRNVSLRDRFGNIWPIGVTKAEREFYFQYGWEKFIEDNTLEDGDIFVFYYDGNGTFDLKILGIRTRCEKKGVGGLKLVVEEEEKNEHQKSVEPKGKKLASNSSSSSSFDDSDDDYMVEEEENKGYEVVVVEEEDERYEVVVEEAEEDDEVEENERADTFKKKAPHSKASVKIDKAPRSKRRRVEETKEGEYEDEEEEEEQNERAGTLKQKVSCSKAGYKRTAARKVWDRHDQFGAEIFKSGRATQPKNPYFIAKIQAKGRDQLYVPIDVVKDFNLELPSSMTVRDSTGREFETKLENWKDGRIWLIGGWHSLCRRNFVEKDVRCICEFVKGKGQKDLYLEVQILHEGSVSNPNKKHMEEEEEDDDDDDDEEEETEEEEEEQEENLRTDTFKKKAPHSKARCKRDTGRKVRDIPDQYGADIFKSGRATQPKNPYFVAKIQAKRRDQLYIPIDVVRDYKLELPSRMTIRDSAGREFETKRKNWKDGRIWLIGGWRSICRWNLVEKDDRCICEFVRGKGENDIYLQVQVLHEGSISK